jgi:hypothetical protein
MHNSREKNMHTTLLDKNHHSEEGEEEETS